MNIESAKYTSEGNVAVVINGTVHNVPAVDGNRHYKILMEWVAEDPEVNIIDPADPEPALPTDDEKIDSIDPILFAFLKAYAKREGVTMAQLKTAIKAEL